MKRVVCEERTDEGLRFFKDGCCGTIRTIDGGGDKRVIEIKVIGQMDNKMDNTFESANRVYDAEGLSPTINTCGGGGLQPKVIVASRGRNPQNPSDRTSGNHVEQRLEPNSQGICNTITSVQKDNMVLEPQIKRVDIPQTVRVRKYEVDCNLLCECLRDHKYDSNFSNKEIAAALDRPITLVEHWFRKDSSFSIPDADTWYQLKELLGIQTDEFDLPITEFIEQDGVYEKANRCYMTDGISPTITSASADEKILEPRLVGGLGEKDWGSQWRQGNRVYDSNAVAMALHAQPVGNTGGNSYLYAVETRQQYRIRKLTPLECWRLMDFTDEDYYKAEKVNSNTQLYKQAGNSIVKSVLMAIFKQMM